jgi:hypothetical protein
MEALRAAAKKPKTEETKRRMSEASKRRGADPDYREKMSRATIGIPKTPEHRANLSVAMRRVRSS